MNGQRGEMERLEKGWKTVFIIWLAMLASLCVYLILCDLLEAQLQVTVDDSFPIDSIKYALYGVSLATLIGVYYLRNYLLNNPGLPLNVNPTSQVQHPAVARYSIIIVIVSALLESIGIYGLVLFLLSKDTAALYQLIAVSAAGLIYFRPRKEELLFLADRMK